jgi:hypothetical protein
MTVKRTRDFSTHLPELAERCHVWVVDTPANRQAAEAVWASGPSDRTHGVITFKIYEGESIEKPAHGDVKSEEERLLAAASPHLRALIVAGMETGCRVGELLSLQWHQVRWDLNEIHLPASKTKTRDQRDVPMTPNVRAVQHPAPKSVQ